MAGMLLMQVPNTQGLRFPNEGLHTRPRNARWWYPATSVRLRAGQALQRHRLVVVLNQDEEQPTPPVRSCDYVTDDGKQHLTVELEREVQLLEVLRPAHGQEAGVTTPSSRQTFAKRRRLGDASTAGSPSRA